MNKRIYIFISLVFFVFSISAQVGMGQWRTHLAYNAADQITQSENKVFAVSEGSLFSVDKRDGSMEFYSKLNGLNGTYISRIQYDNSNKVLLIIYQDGNIDFLSANGVKNLPDFYNKQMSANKAVNHVLFSGNTAYLSCNFGIITVDMKRMEIKDTYYIGDNASEVKVLNTVIFKDKIYAVSETDIYTATASSPTLISYESWSKLINLPGVGNYQALLSFGDNLILLRDGNLYKQDVNGLWSNLELNLGYTKIFVSGNYLQTYTGSQTFVYDNQFNKSEIIGISNLKDGIFDTATSKFWFAGDARGIAEYQNANVNFYKPIGPEMNRPYKVKFSDNRLFVLPGGRWASQDERPGVIMIYENNVWKNISNESIATHTNGIGAKDFIDIAIDPNDKTHFFITSYGNGVFEFRNDEFYKWHNIDNSLIETIYPNGTNFEKYNYIRMGGGTYDEDGNIWFSNSGVGGAVKILKKDGTWAKIQSPLLTNHTLGEVLILNQNKNIKYLLNHRLGVLLSAIDDNGTLDDASDDRYIRLTSIPIQDQTDNVSIEFFFSITQDKNGVVWLGTSKGPFIFNNPTKVFDSDFAMSRIKIPRNDGTILADYLLENENIWAIKVDGANRKWIGTEFTGVYLVSENGQEIIHHFTTQNSPLLSNRIFSIDINPKTGEVFFGTGGGLVSFQSDAADAENVFKNVHVYPNPVRENFSGVITITGLVEKTNVKITDVAGNLVSETVSNGSIATWDGKNKFGQKVSTGVYLAICVSSDGEQSTTTKIMVIN